MSPGRLSIKLIQINLDYLERVKMDMNQYLSLMKLYAYHEEERVLPIRVYRDDLEFLIERGYIVEEKGIVSLTDSGRRIFEPENDLFEEFFALYPHKVPDGVGGNRVLGTTKPDTIFGTKMRKKWNNITKGNEELQRTMIDALKYELNYKKTTNSLQFMQGMEVWFNKATWEKYADAAKEPEYRRKDKLL